MGFMCTYVPEEILYAAGVLPIRISGDSRELELERANSYLYVNNCSMIRSCLELALQGQYDGLDGLVAGYTCDGARRLYDVWKRYLPLSFMEILLVPRKSTDEALELYREELVKLRQKLEKFMGIKISEEALRGAIQKLNNTRELLHRLYDLRKSDPPLISGAESLEVLNASTRMDKEHFNRLLEKLLGEVEQRRYNTLEKRPRLMISGSMLNNPDFIRVIEEMGAWVVADELCTGTRSFWDLVDPSLEPIEGIARRYLNNFPCARMDPPEVRFHQITQMIQEFRVQGVVSQIIRYCAPYEHDQPFLARYIEQETGVPVLSLDVEYGQEGTGQVKTRVQAFLEMLAGIKDKMLKVPDRYASIGG